MKYLGIDYGTKRVGVAVSDDASEFAFPKAVLEISTAYDEIITLINDEKISAVVIGESLATNGKENELSSHINKFKARLVLETGLPVFFEREGFSTFEAHRYQTKKGHRDDSAAAVILQRFLDKQKK